MDDAEVVRVPERLEHVDHQHEPEIGRHGLAEGLEQRAQIAARHVLERHPPRLAFAAEVVDLRDVRMNEARGELGLALEAAHEVGLRRALREHALEADLAREAVVTGPSGEERLGHPATPEWAHDLERPEPHARGEPITHARSERGAACPMSDA